MMSCSLSCGKIIDAADLGIRHRFRGPPESTAHQGSCIMLGKPGLAVAFLVLRASREPSQGILWTGVSSAIPLAPLDLISPAAPQPFAKHVDRLAGVFAQVEATEALSDMGEAVEDAAAVGK